ncbi:MAG: hypothetical protein ACRDSH_03805, partial [Pseudonocardiaceae bacterium]
MELARNVGGTEDEKHAQRLFQLHSEQLRQYYDQALGQRGLVFFAGFGCILGGFAVVAFTFHALSSIHDVPEKIVVAVLGGVGGILANFIAFIYLRMFSETIQSVGNFHDRLVLTHHLHFANVLISKMSSRDKADDALKRTLFKSRFRMSDRLLGVSQQKATVP